MFQFCDTTDVLFAILDIGARRTTKDKHIVQNITIVDSRYRLFYMVLLL